ncbi:MAG: hypothetical protein WB392_08275 [Methanotrichaceae archaeon]
MTNSKELENLGNAIAEIGKGKTCFTMQAIKEVKEALLKKGYEGAELYGAQLAEADENTELLRVLMICRKYNLSPENAIRVLDNLNKIESGKW